MYVYCIESGRPSASAEMSDFSIIASRPFCVWNWPSSILSESGLGPYRAIEDKSEVSGGQTRELLCACQ